MDTMNSPAVRAPLGSMSPEGEDSFSDVDTMASMPPASPLEMPKQSLSRFDSGRAHRGFPRSRRWKAWLSRLVVFGGAIGLTAYGANEMYGVVAIGPITGLEWVLLILFVINFSWISLALTSAIVGLIAVIADKHKPQMTELSQRVAVVMPTYNEDPTRVFSALAAIIDNVCDGPHGSNARRFDWFVLSDTTDPDIWIAEERVFIELRRRLSRKANIFYRHRPKNTARKAGNIEDFVTGWGAAYDQMLVLDADSLMTADAIVALATAMERDPDAGIIQSLPLIINRNTMFARLQQFAARIYGPVIATGLAVWSDRDGNYWGHNAVIRTRAFAESCGLPILPGRPPLGGPILSHDFVEAALIARNGWDVYMLPHVSGSYEESPPTLIDLAIRDRRWCQGNLQHASVLLARGLRLASRQHFATGIMSYLASPIWLAQLLVGITLVLQSHYVRPEYFTNEFALLPAFPKFDAERALQLLGITMVVLLLPKFFGLGLSLADPTIRRGCGGAARMTISALIEILFSSLMAPIMMVVQTGAVIHILMGMDSGWSPQKRDDGSIPFKAILRRHFPHMVLGIATLIAGFLISPSLVGWMSPTIAGLLLSPLLTWGSGLLSTGLGLKRAKLLLTPEETHSPPIVESAAKWRATLTHPDALAIDGLEVLFRNRELRDLHMRFLPAPVMRARGRIDVDSAMATAKLNEAASIDEAVGWLTRQERIAVLLDRSLLDRLAALPAAVAANSQT